MRKIKTVNRGASRYHHLLIGLLLVFGLSLAHAQTVDYDLNQATRTIKDVDKGLERLRPGDVATYNRLSGKLNKAAKHLQSTQSKSHPDFEVAVKRWGELQAQMAAIAQDWQAAQQKAQAEQQQRQAAQQKAQAEQQQRQAAQRKALAEQQQKQAAEQQAQQARQQAAQAAAKPQVEPVNLDPLMDKYQRSNLPKLSETATPEQARTWAEHMKALQTTTLEADVATVDAALSSGAASEADATRVRQWISDQFQDNIQRTVTQQIQMNEGVITSMEYSADLINGVADGDMNGAYRFAGGDKYQNNATRLDNAIRAGAVAAVFDDVFGASNPARAGKLEKITKARVRLDELLPAATEQAEVFANAPRKERPVTKDFLAPIAQEYWLDGSIMAESDAEGGIWIDANNVGDITHNGKIWVEANERGSIEPNGEVWFDGNEVGSLEPDGEVWRDGNQVGLIEQNGTVWVNSNPAGEIVPFQGEWKRAAILYYFGDFFR